MSEQETPETDAVYNKDWKDGKSTTLASLMIKHAENMERQRDRARAALSRYEP